MSQSYFNFRPFKIYKNLGIELQWSESSLFSLFVQLNLGHMIKGIAQTFFKLVEKRTEREKDLNSITLFWINAIK